MRRAILILVLAAGALAAGACSGRATPGRPVPDFHARLLNGREVSLASFRGRVLVLNFWASWCPPCVEETPALNALAKVLPPARVAILGISIDEDPVAYRTFLNRYHITFLTARDPSQAIMHRYGTVQIPETYIISPDGRLARKLVSVANFTSPTMIAYLRRLSGSAPGSPASLVPLAPR